MKKHLCGLSRCYSHLQLCTIFMVSRIKKNFCGKKNRSSCMYNHLRRAKICGVTDKNTYVVQGLGTV